MTGRRKTYGSSRVFVLSLVFSTIQLRSQKIKNETPRPKTTEMSALKMGPIENRLTSL